MTVLATYTLVPNKFRVEINSGSEPTIVLQEFITGSWTTPSGGPYTSNQMMQLWQAMAEIGFGPR